MKLLPDQLEDIASGGIEKDEINGFERGAGFQVFDRFREHDARALVHGEAGDSGADSGEGDGFEFAVSGKTKGVGGGSGKGFGSGGGATEAHAGGVNDVAGLEFAAGSNGRIADRDAAEFIALALDFVAALAANGSSYTAAENEIVVGGIDDGVDVHFGEVALLNDDALGQRSHWKYCRTGGVGSGRKQISGSRDQEPARQQTGFRPRASGTANKSWCVGHSGGKRRLAAALHALS